MRRLRDFVAQTYFSFDLRSLAFFRVVFALALLSDLYLRQRVLDVFYTNEGLIPNHTLLWAPLGPYVFSLFFTASHAREAQLLMVLCALAFSCLLIGYRTKLAQVSSFIALISLNGRLALLENGGDVVLCLLAIWSLFLPLGERFSIDALLRSLRSRPELHVAQLNERARPDPRRAYSLACFALILQFSAIYYFNVVHKTGVGWRDGSAVHYVLHQDRLIKPLGVWMREHVPEGVLAALTRATIVVETIGVIAIASPFFIQFTRTLALILMPLMHLGFELCLDLGVFSFAMIAFYPLLLSARHWQLIEQWIARRHQRRRLYVDEDCPLCLALARLLARLDPLERLEFASSADLPTRDLDGGPVVIDLASGQIRRRGAALSALLRCLPFGGALAWPLRLPLLDRLADSLCEKVARSRIALGRFFGVGERSAPPPPSAAPIKVLLGRVKLAVREALVAIFLVAATAEALNANAAVPASWHFARPGWCEAIVQYPRAFQGWRMFAPDAPLEDATIEVDAETEDHRRVDPYNEIASRVHAPGVTGIAPYLHQNQFFTAYSLFISLPQYRPYTTAFREWILRYPERTGRPRDRIIRFTAYSLTDSSPPPGKTESTNFKRTPFMSFPP